MAQVSQYAPWLWEYFGLTVLTVWDVDTLQFCGFVNFIDTQRALQRQEGQGRG